MRRAGLASVTGRPKWKRIKPDNTASDLVQRKFARTGSNQLPKQTAERLTGRRLRAVSG